MATTDPKTAAPDTDAGKTKSKRAVRLAKATNVAFSLEPEVRARFSQEAKDQGMELGHYLQKVLENHLLDSAPEDDPLAERIRAKRAVIDHVVNLAQELDGKGKFDEHFVVTVMKEAAKDDTFMGLYHIAIGGEGKAAARAQKPLNQQLGRLIRKSVGARGLRTDAGRVARAQVSGEIISSYTLLTKTS
ncbi:hypothetical protein [Aestuariicoccus sp. MJ-SS9]|uniref:hypothetical protein n=1 Tax=Aestuariicoccus sp. MJ-SS9 TaxID=3079855 RepID=UPI00290D9CB7|nr:hypothetical protein [Aestuariicoccus sp. MJ-SS9]MDU8912882.1 hypothetical protein [Aestuariicoccus sp. MJ-SS9]